eukprot:668344-Hanusia_phi.AAC.3
MTELPGEWSARRVKSRMHDQVMMIQFDAHMPLTDLLSFPTTVFVERAAEVDANGELVILCERCSPSNMLQIYGRNPATYQEVAVQSCTDLIRLQRVLRACAESPAALWWSTW